MLLSFTVDLYSNLSVRAHEWAFHCPQCEVKAPITTAVNDLSAATQGGAVELNLLLAG
jgi:hypothetical protein